MGGFFTSNDIVSISIPWYTIILLKSLASMCLKYLRCMIPEVFTKRFECNEPGMFNLHHGFDIAENRFYFVAVFHMMTFQSTDHSSGLSGSTLSGLLSCDPVIPPLFPRNCIGTSLDHISSSAIAVLASLAF